MEDLVFTEIEELKKNLWNLSQKIDALAERVSILEN